jgi:hypothetical protein
MAPIVMWQDPALRNSRDGRLIASTMVMAVRQQTGGILPRMCRGQECIDLSQLAASGPIVRLDRPGGFSHVIAIIIPPPPGWV